EEIRREGFVRVRVDGEIRDIGDEIQLDRYKQHTIEVVVDRLVRREGIETRLAESTETALKMGKGIVGILYEMPQPSLDGMAEGQGSGVEGQGSRVEGRGSD